MKTATKLFSIQAKYFPGNGLGCYSEYSNKNVLIDGRIYKVTKAKTGKNGEKTYLLSFVPLKTYSSKDYIVDFSITPKFGRIYSDIGDGGSCRVVVFYQKPHCHSGGMYDKSLVFKKTHLDYLLHGVMDVIPFRFLHGELGYVNAEGKVLENKHFSSMDVLIAEKAFDYAFKNIDSFEVIKN